MSTTWEAYDLVIIVRRLEDSLYLEQGRSQLPTCGEQRHADAFWCRVFTDTVRYGRQHKVISCNGQTMDFKTHVAGYLCHRRVLALCKAAVIHDAITVSFAGQRRPSQQTSCWNGITRNEGQTSVCIVFKQT